MLVQCYTVSHLPSIAGIYILLPVGNYGKNNKTQKGKEFIAKEVDVNSHKTRDSIMVLEGQRQKHMVSVSVELSGCYHGLKSDTCLIQPPAGVLRYFMNGEIGE